MKTPLIAALCLAIIVAPAAFGAVDAAALFKTKCAPCHGATGKADTPMGQRLGAKPLPSPEVQNQTDAQLTDTVTNGKGKKMPKFGTQLSSEQITALIAHIRVLGKK